MRLLIEKILSNNRLSIFFVFIFFVFLTVAINKYIAVPSESNLPSRNKTTIGIKYQIRDFEYYVIITKSYLFGEIDSMYKNQSQLNALENFFGFKPDVAFPLGISPTAIFIYLPFVYIFELDSSLSFSLWVSFSLFLFTIALLVSFRYISEKNKISIPWLFLRILLFVFSFTMIACILLGQTTLMACALITFLIVEILRSIDANRFPRPWIVYPVMFFLSIKIPYIIISIGTLFVFGFFYESFLSILFISSIYFMIGIWGGFELYQDWFKQLAVFSAPIYPANYPISYLIDTIVNIRSAFSEYIGHVMAVAVTEIIFIVGIAFVIIVSFLRYMYPISLQRITSKITPQQLVVLLIGIFLLSMPYFGAYEDILMIVLFIISAVYIETDKISTIQNVFIAFCLWFVLNYRLFLFKNIVVVFLIMKFTVFLGLYGIMKRNETQ